MKKIKYLFIALLMVGFAACEYDNYDPPSITVSGKLVTADGKNFLYEGSKGLLTAIQKGFGKEDGGTSFYVDHNGNYTQLLFAGEYWLTLQNNVYPFEFKDFQPLAAGGYDSIRIDLKSNYEKNFEVIPYYTFSDFTAAVEGSNVVLTAKIHKTKETTRIEVPRTVFARGYLSTTQIVNGATPCVRSTRAVISAETGEIKVSVPLTGTGASYREVYKNNFRDYAYCRVSIEVDGISEYYLFSDIIKIEGLPVK